MNWRSTQTMRHLETYAETRQAVEMIETHDLKKQQHMNLQHCKSRQVYKGCLGLEKDPVQSQSGLQVGALNHNLPSI